MPNKAHAKSKSKSTSKKPEKRFAEPKPVKNFCSTPPKKKTLTAICSIKRVKKSERGLSWARCHKKYPTATKKGSE